jgi:diacylglycerol O-acyltransferase
MTQLKTLDAALRKAQDPDQHASLAISAVAIIDGTVPDIDLLKRFLAERIQAIPRCKQVPGAHPFDISADEWVDYPEFDVVDHLRRVALPRPGDDAELFRAIAHALERPLDLNRPLWECWVIEGLKDNQWAILMKIHHCMADGISAAHILTRLCDDADGSTFANHTGAQHASPPQRRGLTVADALLRASAVAGTVNSALTGMVWPGARTAPVGPATKRCYSTVRVPLAEVERVCRKFNVTTNDVAVAAITEGFRTVLLQRGEQPRANSLRTLLPASMRAVLPFLPVEHADPVQRLRTVHNRLQAERNDRHQSGRLLQSWLNTWPIALRSNAIQLLTRLPHRGIVTLATNVPGPRHQLRLLGKPMQRLLPIPPTALQLNTGVAVLSYADDLVFGLTAGYDAACDIKGVAAGIEQEMARLVALSQDSVLLFSTERRANSSRGSAGAAHRGQVPAPGRVRW